MTTLTQDQDSKKINFEFYKNYNKFKYKSRLYPFYWAHSNELDQEIIKKYPISAIKFHPSISQSTIDKNESILKLCSKYNKPILIHCGRNKKSNIDHILKINEYYPEIKFICAHMGGLATDLIMRTFKIIKNGDKYSDNLWFDTSGCHSPDIIKKGIDIYGEDKILFGTDRPFHDYKVSKFVIDNIDASNQVKEKIFHNNFQNIITRV